VSHAGDWVTSVFSVTGVDDVKLTTLELDADVASDAADTIKAESLIDNLLCRSSSSR